MNNRLSLYIFTALLVACALFTLTSSTALPESVAIHFDAKNGADAWITRDQYRILIVAALISLPLLLVWLMARLPRFTGGKGQIPDHEYWFASERRDATEQFLLSHSCWLGSITVAIIFGIHIAIRRANAFAPPTLATDQFLIMVLTYLCGLAWWITRFLRHFDKARNDSRSR